MSTSVAAGRPRARPALAPVAAGIILLTSGIAHLGGGAMQAADWLAVAAPIPLAGPDAGLWLTRAAGLLEVLLAVAIAVPPTRRVGFHATLGAIVAAAGIALLYRPALALAPGGLAGLLGGGTAGSLAPLALVSVSALVGIQTKTEDVH